jgi:hypothetical protein
MSTASADAVETAAPRTPRGSRVRRAWRRGALVGATALMTAQPGMAQIAPGYSGRSDGGVEYMDTEEAMRTLSAFGNCYARLSTARAFELLGTDPGSRAEAETYRRLFRRDTQNCLGEGTELSMPVAFVRGAIAEGLLERGIALPANLVLAAPAPGVEVRRLSEAARCHAVAHGAEIRAMLATPPGGQREMAALRPMVEGFFRCLPASARNRRLGASQLRYLLAEALLRLPAAATTGTR